MRDATTFLRWLQFPSRYHFWTSLLIVVFSMLVISSQISDRQGFASGDLHKDVMERWGAPIVQAAPSVRYVESGSVFNSLHPLALDRQHVRLDAEMNYRKRGLIYFSGFEFAFHGDYSVQNPRDHDIDIVFVFPVHADRNRILLSDRTFLVNGEATDIDLDETSNRLVWTGRLAPEESADFEIAFNGRGLDLFTYRMDPALPVRQFDLDVRIQGGDTYDYAAGVVPAHTVTAGDDDVRLRWNFPSLESGVPVGVTLPSETSFDSIILTMIRRSWTVFVLFFVAVIGLSLFFERRLMRHESWLIASSYAFFFVLLPYLAAYMHFHLAYALTALAIGALVQVHLERVFGRRARPHAAALILTMLWLPTIAVILENYTGLIYSLEIFAALLFLMLLTTRSDFRTMLYQLEAFVTPRETSDAK